MFTEWSIIPSKTLRSIFLILRNETERWDLTLANGREILNNIGLWSEIEDSIGVKLKGLTPEQHTRSKICPLLCVGKLRN